VGIDRRRAKYLDVHIVMLSLSAVARNSHRVGVEIDATRKRDTRSPPASIIQVF